MSGVEVMIVVIMAFGAVSAIVVKRSGPGRVERKRRKRERKRRKRERTRLRLQKIATKGQDGEGRKCDEERLEGESDSTTK